MGSTGVKEIDNFAKDPVGALVNTMLQIGTVGTVGYNRDNGGITKGATIRAADEGLGELTGRNLAREESAKADARIEAEKKAREKEKANELVQLEREDRSASYAAQGAQSFGSMRGFRKKLSMGDEKDFLGM